MTETGDQATCGKGLAANSRVPAAFARLLGALADNLAVHMTSLDARDRDARREYEAYASLLSRYRQIATDLAHAASEMAGYQDLPMAPHDEQALAQPRVVEVFRDYVQAECELLERLQESHRINRDMLREMGIAEEGE